MATNFAEFITTFTRFGKGLSASTVAVANAYVAFNKGSTAGKLKLYAYIQALEGVVKQRSEFHGIELIEPKKETADHSVSKTTSIEQHTMSEYERQMLEMKKKKLEMKQQELEAQQKMKQQELEAQEKMKQKDLQIKKQKLETQMAMKQQELEAQEKMKQKDLQMKKQKLETQMAMKEKELETKKSLKEMEITANKDMLKQRIQHEKEENNKNRKLMTYNVFSDRWAQAIMPACYGTPSNWGMSSKHIVRAIELNAKDMPKEHVEAVINTIASATTNMKLADGSVEPVVDLKHIKMINDITNDHPVELTPEDETNLNALVVDDAEDALDVIKSINADGKDNKAEEDDVEYKVSDKVDDNTEYEHADDLSGETSEYIKTLMNKIVSTVRSEGRITYELVLTAHTNNHSFKELNQHKNVIARLVKYGQHCKNELITRSSIRTPTEIKRDIMNQKTKRRNSMPKDIVMLMKSENEYNSDSGEFKCFVCRKTMHIDDNDIDRMHIVARVDGGDCGYDNLALGCSKCNRSSGRVNPLDIKQ